MSGEALGTSRHRAAHAWLLLPVAVVAVGAVAAIDGITISHEQPRYGLAAMIIWEGSSWLTFILFLWIAWIAYRIAPLAARPRWKLLVHIPAALLFSLAHVAGFVGLRKFVYWLGHAQYEFGAFFPNFRYEFTKDALGYVLFIAAFALVEHLVRQQSRIDARRDGRSPSTSAMAPNSPACGWIRFSPSPRREIMSSSYSTMGVSS